MEGFAMSMLGKIMDAVFGSRAQAAPTAGSTTAPTGSAPPPTAAPAATPSTAAAPQPTGTAAGLGQADAAPQSPATADTSTAAGSSAAGDVDVASVLDKAVEARGEQLNWRTSIVDLMKALGLDSSITARKELAADLDYTGDTSDSATMNIWLHKRLMQKLAENGGRLPSDLAN
jgi:hypothetical protein